MTWIGSLGCTLVGMGPCTVLFLFTIADSPIKVIILLASAFFWLASFLLSAIVWFAVVPLRSKLAFGLTVAVLFQEIIRFLFYLLLRKTDQKLQSLAMVTYGSTFEVEQPTTTSSSVTHRQPEPASTTTNVNLPNNNNNTDADSSHVHHRQSPTDNQSPTSSGVLYVDPTNEPSPPGNGTNRLILFDARVTSYVAGLGFGLMTCLMELVHVYLESRGPAIGSPPVVDDFDATSIKSTFVLAASECTCISLMQILWSMLLFAAFEIRSYLVIIVVYLMHFGLSYLTLLNQLASPWPEAVCFVYVACLFGLVGTTYYLLLGKEEGCWLMSTARGAGSSSRLGYINLTRRRVPTTVASNAGC